MKIIVNEYILKNAMLPLCVTILMAILVIILAIIFVNRSLRK